MPNSLAIAHKFEQFVTLYGEDPFISKTISKMVSTRVATLNKELLLKESKSMTLSLVLIAISKTLSGANI